MKENLDLCRLVQQGNLDEIKRISRSDLQFATDTNGYSLITHAAYYNQQHVFDYLMTQGCDINFLHSNSTTNNEKSLTPLMYALWLGQNGIAMRDMILRENPLLSPKEYYKDTHSSVGAVTPLAIYLSNLSVNRKNIISIQKPIIELEPLPQNNQSLNLSLTGALDHIAPRFSSNLKSPELRMCERLLPKHISEPNLQPAWLIILKQAINTKKVSIVDYLLPFAKNLNLNDYSELENLAAQHGDIEIAWLIHRHRYTQYSESHQNSGNNFQKGCIAHFLQSQQKTEAAFPDPVKIDLNAQQKQQSLIKILSHPGFIKDFETCLELAVKAENHLYLCALVDSRFANIHNIHVINLLTFVHYHRKASALTDLLEAFKRKGFTLQESFHSSATHLLTNYTDKQNIEGFKALTNYFKLEPSWYVLNFYKAILSRKTHTVLHGMKVISFTTFAPLIELYTAACQSKQNQIASTILNTIASKDFLNFENCRTPLFDIAVASQDIEIITSMLRTMTVNGQLKNICDHTNVHILAMLAGTKHFSLLNTCIQQQPNWLNQYKNEQSPLMYAIQTNNFLAVKNLISLGAETNCLYNGTKMSMFNYAKKVCPEIFKKLSSYYPYKYHMSWLGDHSTTIGVTAVSIGMPTLSYFIPRMTKLFQTDDADSLAPPPPAPPLL
ncbi:MAG: hypothetical protein VXW87_00390 [Pseudomonadota bacterium]|nr:hypothetical protein [Pseudomonadota bacterium]